MKKSQAKGTKAKAAIKTAPTRKAPSPKTAGGKASAGKLAPRAKRAHPVQPERARGGKSRAIEAPAPDRVVRIRALDPQAKCGPGTSVQELYRVDERTDGKAVATHLVFFDRHGWYCEHGRSCPAVAEVRKSQRR